MMSSGAGWCLERRVAIASSVSFAIESVEATRSSGAWMLPSIYFTLIEAFIVSWLACNLHYVVLCACVTH